jgi:uncharacterized protein (TIGR02145 family)
MSMKFLMTLIVIFTVAVFIRCEDKAVGDDVAAVQDADGNVYGVVKIGDQVWTCENLRTTRYNDGSPIPQIVENGAWDRDTVGAFCSYNNTADKDTIVKYGLLYNWHAVNTGKLAPAGWRVPTDKDWDVLEKYLIENGYNFDGSRTGNKIGKALSNASGWEPSDEVGSIGAGLSDNNRSGFSAVGGGSRYTGGSADGNNYVKLDHYGFWWTVSIAYSDGNYSTVWIRELAWCDGELRKGCTNCLPCGFSVRLVRN